LVLITNDAWFGPDAGPRQHFAQARLRAIEQGLPMVRVGNTGLTAMIDARGAVTASLPFEKVGYVDATLPQARAETIFARFGSWPLVIVILLSCSAVAIRRRIISG
jgi:apolipoprotein N-acyltransferase